jgi:crossover junction endodeoxyribonuclease RusA
MTRIKLPYPPSINHYWRHNRGRHHISKEGLAYRRQVMWLYKGEPEHTGRLSVAIDVHPPDKRRRDLDNTLKVVLDSLEKAGAYKDDSQIDKLLVTRKGSGGYIVVTVAGA